MSWQAINKILGLAIINRVFAEYLLRDPQQALYAYGIELSSEELTILCACQAQTLSELSQQLVEKLGLESASENKIWETDEIDRE